MNVVERTTGDNSYVLMQYFHHQSVSPHLESVPLSRAAPFRAARLRKALDRLNMDDRPGPGG